MLALHKSVETHKSGGQLKNMNARIILENEVLQGLISSDCVNWTLIKLCAAYKYVSIFI